MPRNTTIILFGDPDDQHLRVEIRGEEILLISHEHIMQKTTNIWRDRLMVSMPVEKWMLVARLIAPDQFVGGPDDTGETAVSEGPSVAGGHDAQGDTGRGL